MIHVSVDISSETPLEIKNIKKTGLISDLLSDREIIVLDRKRFNSAYMIFAFEKIKKKHGIDYKTIIILNYLNELGVFSYRIKIDSKEIRLVDYVELGLISRDFKIKQKKLYRLTEKSIRIVSDFNDILSNESSFISQNRQADIDNLDDKVSSALSNYFKS